METKKQLSGHEEINMVYQCAMKCEKDKVYDHPGNCPVCNMELVQVDSGGSHEHHHHNC